MAWSWHFTPTRIYTDKRFLRLSKSDELAASLLLRLYHACDRHGRGPYDDLALAAKTGLVAAVDLIDRLDRLYATGMVLRSADGESWELERYDDDAPRDVKRDRPASEYAQGQQNGSREKSGGDPGSIRGDSGGDPGSIRGDSGDDPEGDRKNPAHACAGAPPRALPPGRETRQGKEGREGKAEDAPQASSQPTPAGSTDARASSALSGPSDGDAVPGVASAPALGGAGSAPEVRAAEQQPPPPTGRNMPMRDYVRIYGPAPLRTQYPSTEAHQAAIAEWLARSDPPAASAEVSA